MKLITFDSAFFTRPARRPSVAQAPDPVRRRQSEGWNFVRRGGVERRSVSKNRPEHPTSDVKIRHQFPPLLP